VANPASGIRTKPTTPIPQLQRIGRPVQPLCMSYPDSRWCPWCDACAGWKFATSASLVPGAPISSAGHGGRRPYVQVVAVAADWNGVIYEGAVGLWAVGGEDPVMSNSLFRIMSMTKMVCPVAVLEDFDGDTRGCGRLAAAPR